MSLSPEIKVFSAETVTASNTTCNALPLRASVFNLFLLATQAVAFWPLWEWYAMRVIRFPDNRAGLLALLAATIVACLGMRPHVARVRLHLPFMCILVYTITQPFLHPLVGCILAAICIGYTAGNYIHPSRRLPVIGLLLLALPVIPSMQTYIGYPLRVLVAELAAPLARMAGTLETTREGVGLRWSGGLVLVDEPCSGIRMLWTGCFLALTMAGLFAMSLRRALMLGAITLLVVISANLLRCMALFTAEIRQVEVDERQHSLLGLGIFSLAGVLIVSFALHMCAEGKRS